MRILLTVEYDGTDFVGYQSQNNGRAVQDVLNEALSELYKTKINVTGCSRTDSGVHARAHLSHADVPFFIPEDRVPLALNAFLPADISVKAAKYVREDFSARFDNKGKRYIYRVYFGRTKSPLLSRYAYYSSYDLDVEEMKKAAVHFAGMHNFEAFCAAGSTQTTFDRRLYEVNVREVPSDCIGTTLLEIEVKGEAFLYNMVRIIAGTLVDVGTGKINQADIPSIIDSRDRTKAGKTLPPEGLTLEEVYLDQSDLY